MLTVPAEDSWPQAVVLDSLRGSGTRRALLRAQTSPSALDIAMTVGDESWLRVEPSSPPSAWGAQRPTQVGERFSRKALIPSWASQVIEFVAMTSRMAS